MSDHQVCFCTLALGQRYRLLALKLAQDVATFAHCPLVVLTDRPADFAHHPHVLAIKHQQQSVSCCHDKLHVLEKALFLYDTCIYVDAGTRILADMPVTHWSPGITALPPGNYALPNKAHDRKKSGRLTQTIAQKFNLDLRRVQPISEFLFVIKVESGRELAFLSVWDRIGKYFELNGIYGGLSRAIDLAAATAGLSICYEAMPGVVLGQQSINNQATQSQRSPKPQLGRWWKPRGLLGGVRPVPASAIAQLQKLLTRTYYQLRLQIITLSDAGFYHSRLVSRLVSWCAFSFKYIHASLK